LVIYLVIYLVFNLVKPAIAKNAALLNDGGANALLRSCVDDDGIDLFLRMRTFLLPPSLANPFDDRIAIL